MHEIPTEYRVMINPSPDLASVIEKQLVNIARNIYNRDTKNVIYRVRATDKHTNPRKLFISGMGEVLEGEIGLHMGISQIMLVNEYEEETLFEEMSKISKKINPFILKSTVLGDYGDNFTIFLAFSKNNDADKLVSLIEQNMKPFFKGEGEKREILHFTLLYDDSSESNIRKAWKFIDESSLINMELPVSSLWLWKNKEGWKP
ncbi:MAG: hypothetical protein ABIJ05_01885 [Patescibacteria group bacterium]